MKKWVLEQTKAETSLKAKIPNKLSYLQAHQEKVGFSGKDIAGRERPNMSWTDSTKETTGAEQGCRGQLTVHTHKLPGVRPYSMA